MPDNMDHLIAECQTVAENSLYNAQTHFELADIIKRRAEKKARWLVIVPSAVAGIAGVLTAVGLPAWVGAFSAVGGFLAAVYSAFGESESPVRHRLAANQWTSLRHEARALSETYFKELPHEQFLAEARRIDDRYTTLCQALEPTDKEAFDKARERVKSGLFVPDFREKETTASKQLKS
jgi:hypothetical protein